MSDDTLGYAGTQKPGDNQGDYNAQTFLAQSLINRIAGATLVQIVSVTNSGGLAPVGFVDVQPLVNQLDGYGNAVPHGVVHNLPYFRLQGGASAVILDPQPGDIGIAVFASRDLSAVKASKAQANPGSMRTHSMADGLYIGGVLNGAPTQFVRFSATGIELVSPTQIKLTAPDIQLVGPVHASATIVAAGEITAVTTPLHSHVHGGVTPGGGNTAGPTP